MTLFTDKVKLASRAGETKNRTSRSRCELRSYAFYFEAVLTRLLAPDEKTKLR